MIGAGDMSVFDAASIEFASSNAQPFSAVFWSTRFSGALFEFLIATSPPTPALLDGPGGGVPQSCS